MRLLPLILRGVAALAIVFAAATARVVYSGEKEIGLSTDALKAGDPHGAAEHARRAAGFYAPGAPHVGVAYQRLLALGTAAEGLGDRETALFAFQGVRSASIETRWILDVHDADRARADHAIARIQSEAPRPPGTRTLAPQAVEREALEALARDDAPRSEWIVVLLGGVLAAVAGALLVVQRALGATGLFDARRAAPGLGLLLAGAVCWLLALWRA